MLWLNCWCVTNGYNGIFPYIIEIVINWKDIWNSYNLSILLLICNSCLIKTNLLDGLIKQNYIAIYFDKKFK